MAIVNFESKTNSNLQMIGELKGILSAAREQGMNVAIIKIPVKLFAIDSSYQTPIRTNRSLSYLTENFDDAKLLPVTGVPHDEEGKIYLVDGYGRWKASQILDERREKNGEARKYEKLACLVILNAPTEQDARRKFEAEQYAFQNKNVSQMTPLQRHGAYECMGNPAALAINELRDKYHFELSSTKGNRSTGIMGSYSELFHILRVNGKECGDFICSICRDAGFNYKTNGYSTYIMRSLRDVWKFYPENREENAKFVSAWLREREPHHFKANAVARYGMLDFKTACSLYLEDLIVDNVGLSHVRTVDGKKISVISKVS